MKNIRQANRRTALVAAALIAGVSLSACVVQERSTVIDRAVLGGIPKPPEPVAETMPPAPYADSYWIAGHWRWESDKFVWMNGHWEQSRPNMVYENAYWTNENGSWIFTPGRWSPMASAEVPAQVVVAVEPPPPRAEIITVAPAPGFIWIGGFWGWSGGRHVWSAGHWEPGRPGYFYAPSHWVRQPGGWAFAGGHWARH